MSVSVDIYHLQEHPRYASEKPYTMRYVPDSGAAVSNIAREKHTVAVHDMRGAEDTYQLDQNGFTIGRLSSKMTYEDYDSHDKITNVYLPELESILQTMFPGSTVDFNSYLIRKRDAEFPISTGSRYPFSQPNIVAHIDVTADDMVRQIVRRHGPKAETILAGRCQYITIWKPLRGPLYDYPLAVCDRQSIDADKDLEPQDIVDRDEILENVHIYHRPRHRWHYLSGQRDSELLIFRQADTRSGSFGTPHCAIPLSDLRTEALPRESIEVVAFVYSPDGDDNASLGDISH